MRRRIVGIVLGAVTLLGIAAARATSEPANDPAVTAAKAWLALVDAGKYDASWQQSGAMIRGALTQEQWDKTITAARGPLGALRSRSLSMRQEATTLPGAPDGHYVVMQFAATYEHKASAVETVTTTLESDHAWRVVGYYIR
jgi:hypothetical protein